MSRRSRVVFLILATPIVAPARDVVVFRNTSAIEKREGLFLRSTSRPQFDYIPHSDPYPICLDFRPPREVATPALLYYLPDRETRISFIVGVDGRVYSALILEGADVGADLSSLATVRSWRYHPATCNGVPVQAEGKVKLK
jgi:hypothetical protein